jgi:hypothetical protein
LPKRVASGHHLSVHSNDAAGAALWAWRGLLAATLAWSVLAFSGIGVAVIAAWLATELLILRGRRRSSRSAADG